MTLETITNILSNRLRQDTTPSPARISLIKGFKKLSNKQALLIDDKRLSHMSRGSKNKKWEPTALK